MGHVESQFLVRLDIEADPPNDLGETPRGRRRVVYIKSGVFEGPKLKGKIISGGGDAALIRPDKVFEADVRLLMHTDDDALIHLTYRGLWHGPERVMKDLLAREAEVDPSKYYFRTCCFFETSAPGYLWLNKLIAIGYGLPQEKSKGGGIRYDIHEIL